ncbi:single-stranded-DNA-specific exonuclease RecJ [Cytobacillus spongiae]|uniref:single-stranded-DNA-specific exonuclease RecJ n=1 Tax=Cytobacillus spongiae TaxID=2901381 RepID=UPI001F2DEE73|nr:single-stranded-DNA-specific exonuclease RecJ [Cytobacillus spongiae]UII55003.1 single-stranded-DNA-specific exonuclease RecJ [Cytobacillus spongiae]
MLKSRTRWNVRQSNTETVDKLVAELNITPLVASLLVNRGIDTVEEARYFLFDNQLDFHDPFLLTGMDHAVARIKEAIEKQEPIMIFGDYDADGVTSTTVMMKTLTDLGANVQFYIPNRFTEGYGPNEAAFTYAAESGIQLIITVDTGISALHEANVAKDLGVDLIITDHHEPGPMLPEALAIIHPKLEGSSYPFKELAGVGVAFKLSHALYGKVPEHLLEIAVIGTIADLVSLTGENRLIAKRGLKKLRTTNNIGLKALFKQTKVEMDKIDEETIGFLVAPRINAVGRLESADPAVHLLLTDDPYEAETLAEEIDGLNKERQDIVSKIAEEAIQEVEEKYPASEHPVLVIGKVGWNAGVIGIVASRLVEKYYRPIIVLSFDEEKNQAKGSARSIAGFDLFKNLSTCRDILPHFGGHPMAAGMTLKLDDVDELRSRLNDLAKEQLNENDFIPVTDVDGQFALEDIHLSALEELQMLAPYGMNNPKPRIIINDTHLSTIRKIGSNQTHLKVTLSANGATLDGVGFGLGHLCDHISPFSKLSVVGELSINEWNNIRKPQLFLHDLTVKEWQLFDYRGMKQLGKFKDMIPKNETIWVIFNKENYQPLQNLLKEELVLIETIDEARAMIIDHQSVILVDLPSSEDVLKQLVANKKPTRIYTHFYKEESDFFSTIPTRDHFKWFYAFLAKKSPFDLKRYGDDLAKHKGWSRETIDFMSKVFFELDFVKISNGIISLDTSASKKDLNASPTYQRKQAQYALENELLYSSFQQLKNWFDQHIQGSVMIEEEMKEWI